MSPVFETLSFNIVINSLKLVISCVYRRPAANIDAFNEVLFNQILPGMSLVTKKSIVSGDFNLNLFIPYKLPKIDEYMNDFASVCCFLVINRPTRICLENPIVSAS